VLIVHILLGIAIVYLLASLIFTYLAQQLPRRPVVDPPDWGLVIDTKIPAIDGGLLEAWRIEPQGASRGIVVFAHGWGRNRDRMVPRARIFGQWGYTAVIHSARDHGGSTPRRFMNAIRFAEDIEAVIRWVGEPVILYGHSVGAAGAIIAANRSPHNIRALLLEGCYPYTNKAMLSLYRWFNPFFGAVFGRMIVLWMNIFYKWRLDKVSPARLAPSLTTPVMLIHGEKDRRFPLTFAQTLRDSFPNGRVELFVAAGAGHSDSCSTPQYRGAVKRFLDRHVGKLKLC
jgi:pimeloyl-ACP methyl ester carboxylesterase